MNKPWLTFIHGAGGSSSIWFSQIRYFKKDYNLLLIDLRGHGKSIEKHQKETYTFNNISNEVVEVIDFLKIKETHLVGISLGTIILMDIAHRYQGKVTSLVMGGAVIDLNLRAQILMRLGLIFRHVTPYLWLYQFFAYIIMPKKNHQSSREIFVNEAKKMNQKEFVNWFSLVTNVNYLLKYFRNSPINIPTLYIMGQEDYMFLPSVKKIIKTHKSSSLFIIPNCGHVVNIEKSTIFNKTVFHYLGNLL